MSRSAQSFKQTDVTKAVKALANAGVKVARLEIENGKITLFASDPDASEVTDSLDLDRELAEFEAHNGQG